MLLVNSDNNSNSFKTAFCLGSLELVWKKVPGEGNYIKVEIEACAHACVCVCVCEGEQNKGEKLGMLYPKSSIIKQSEENEGFSDPNKKT